jgi:hypothetical protein
MLEDEVIWGHIDILVVAGRSLSRSEQVKTLLAGPSPISPMKAEITIFPISNTDIKLVSTRSWGSFLPFSLIGFPSAGHERDSRSQQQRRTREG